MFPSSGRILLTKKHHLWKSFRFSSHFSKDKRLKLEQNSYSTSHEDGEGILKANHFDVCIIGGGVIGSAAAYFLASRIPDQLRVCVVERDPTYRKCATTLSVGGVRQQFSLPENIRMSLFGVDFIQNHFHTLKVDDIDLPEVNFQPHGYLFLASESGAEAMLDNHRIQRELGAKVKLMTPSKLSYTFPWLNLEGLAFGSYGYANEGWFDPWALLTAFKTKAKSLGVTFVHGEVHSFSNRSIMKDVQSLKSVHVNVSGLMNESVAINADYFVLAADHLLTVECPVEPRKRYVFCLHAPDGPGIACPLTIDPSCAYFRPEGRGGLYLCGQSPQDPSQEPDIDDELTVDYDFFQDRVWPLVAHRVPAFNNSKLRSAWAGCYDYNYWDENAIIGPHPVYKNLIFATGCSGHGIQQGPALGRAVMELIVHGNFETIDLSRFGFDRLINNVKMEERGIV